MSPHFSEVVDGLIKATWNAPVPANAKEASILRAVRSIVVDRLMELAANPNAQTQVRAVATGYLRWLANAFNKAAPGDPETSSHNFFTVEEIERFLARPAEPRKPTTPLATPPGDPIGN